MNYQVWLKSNRRAGILLAIPGMLIIVAAGVIFAITEAPWRWVGLLVLVLFAVATSALARFALLPRVASRDGQLLLYLRGTKPLAVPLDVVECFFLGQGPSMLPRSLEGKQGEASETSTVVVRLAEAAKEWHHRDVRGFLGQWCEGYITIRGTWCEHLNGEVVGQLNRRLVEEHRRLRSARQQPVSA